MAAGLKTVILLAFVLAVGFLLIILSSLLFVVAPLPNAIFAHCGSDDFTDYDGANAAVDTGRFLTSCIAISAFALPLVLAHAEVIKPTASAMAIVGGGLVYGTILAYTAVFKSDAEEF
ncbi:Vacuolar protein sorting-associated protein 55 [Ceratobasidium sp. 414]|nr:Vacuolar protein sorting-associated protein 55 [Ceratobasidium sp. 414]